MLVVKDTQLAGDASLDASWNGRADKACRSTRLLSPASRILRLKASSTSPGFLLHPSFTQVYLDFVQVVKEHGSKNSGRRKPNIRQLLAWHPAEDSMQAKKIGSDSRILRAAPPHDEEQEG